MRTVLVMGAGGAAANGFCRALQMAGGYRLVGTNCDRNDLLLAETDHTELTPTPDSDEWADTVRGLVAKYEVDLIHAQPDEEVAALSYMRDVPTFLPDPVTVKVCQDKWLSHARWRTRPHIPQPRTYQVFFPDDVRNAIRELGEVWLRRVNGAGGAGSVRTGDPSFAVKWIDRQDGWGRFTAAEVLTSQTATWTSLWCDGRLVACQGRRRASWAYAKNTASGVSGITGIGETYGGTQLAIVGAFAVKAITNHPHGLFGVDCAYDRDGDLNPTEINVGRFHTTVPEFFAQAGFNIADLYVRTGLGEVETRYENNNPLADGYRWLRTMDKPPVLVCP